MSNGSFTLRCVVASAVLVTAAASMRPAVAQAAATAADIELATPALDVYRLDLETALRLSSRAAETLARDVVDAERELALARAGLSVVGTLEPGAELERDLVTGTAGWDVDLELDVVGAYRYDRERLLEAGIALERAKARLRAQRRGDLERALLALSGSRLSARDVTEARLEVDEAAADLAAELAAGSPPREVELLEVANALAELDLERELLEHREPSAALAELGLREPSAVDWPEAAMDTDVAWLALPPAPRLVFADTSSPRTPPELRLLALELQLAENVLTLAPFAVARELELYGGYETSGLEAGARLALEGGVPTAEAALGWQLGADEHALTVGFGATFLLSDSSSAETKVAQRDVADARFALATRQAAWPAVAQDQRTLAELAYEEFGLELRALDLNVAALEELEAAGVDDKATASARTAVRRARDASERAWQRYVRALGNYLDVLDVELRLD
ncbi:MAG TPA: hypothetical protein VFD39_03185 [Trueperaceae bacterium]|nr:hypothetical protein [Trueperaceae bacterium]